MGSQGGLPEGVKRGDFIHSHLIPHFWYSQPVGILFTSCFNGGHNVTKESFSESISHLPQRRPIWIRRPFVRVIYNTLSPY